MLDFEAITKITKANLEAINSASSTFATNMVSLAQKNYTEMMAIAEKNPMNSVYTSWANLMQDQFKVYAPAKAYAPSKKD